jgi:uncharacterized phage-associated protein
MNAPESTKAVANFFIQKLNEKGLDVSPMKLQKLVYFAHGWHLALSGDPLIAESVQAWQYGPVVESLYHDVKHWGSDTIRQPIAETVFDNGVLRLVIPSVSDTQKLHLLDQIALIYGEFDALQLSNMTHMPDTPWAAIKSQFANQLNQHSVTIPDALVREYFVRAKQQAGK